METTAPCKQHGELSRQNLVISFKVSYALLQQDIDTTLLFYPRKYDIVTDVISLYHKQYIFRLY